MNRYLVIIFISITCVSALISQAHAFWVWTPETNQWINPKFAVKETPAEQLKYALDFYEQKQYKEAVVELRKLIHHYPKAREAPEAQYYVGVLLEEQGEVFAAFKEYQMVVDKYPFSERSSEIVQRQYEIGLKLLDGQAKKTGFVGAFVWDDYDVVEVFRKVIKNAPYGKWAPAAQYKIGLYLMEKKLYQEARDEFEKVVNDYPESEWAKGASYQIAIVDAKRSSEAQYDQRVTQYAVKELKDFVETHPDAEFSDNAKQKIQELTEKEAENNFVIAQFYEKQKNFKAAKLYYQSIVDQYSESPWASKALQRIRELSNKE
jgi:outer membrane protein assembly factor BamD